MHERYIMNVHSSLMQAVHSIIQTIQTVNPSQHLACTSDITGFFFKKNKHEKYTIAFYFLILCLSDSTLD